jgi:hypothetical protein
MKSAPRSSQRNRRSGTDAHIHSMIGRDDIVVDHARAYWHEAGHVLIARKMEVPVAGVIYTNLKRLPDSRVLGNLQTVYYMTRETNPERRAAEEAEWVRFFGIEKVCTVGAAGMASEEMYSAPAQLALEDGERIKSRSNGTRTIQDFLPQASEILKANAETLKTLVARLIRNGNRVLDQVKSKVVLPQAEWIITRDEIDSICRVR